jgi:hypothetical protein
MTTTNTPTPFLQADMETYLAQLYDTSITIREITPLTGDVADEDAELKGFGYGRPLLLHIEHDHKTEKLVFHTMAGDEFGHDRPSDRARNILLDYNTFNKLPHHVPALDVGVVGENGHLLTIRAALLHFAENMLEIDEFDPSQINEYLAVGK